MNLDTDFDLTTIELAPDEEGEVIATLISSKLNKGDCKSVLYIHGYVDYFFHPHLCEAYHAHAYDFYALDLRKYGRSLLPHQRPNYCASIEEYFEDISAAIKIIQQKGSSRIYLLGHSTGGLTASCYMNKGNKKEEIAGLILNSPFFGMPQPQILTNFLYFITKLIIKIIPYARVEKNPSSVYTKSIHKDYRGEWDFNLDWKPINGFPMYFKWFLAIAEAQRSLKKSNINIPVLVLHSNKSFKARKHSPEATTADIVLDIAHMKTIGPGLGKDVNLVSITDGKHDLFLSLKPVRDHAFKEMFKWLETR